MNMRKEHRESKMGGSCVQSSIIGFRSCGFVLAMGIFGLAFSGCGSPSAANIQLRKRNQDLAAQVETLTGQHQRDVQTVAACERAHPATQSLSPQQLGELFTTHSLTFGPLTGGDNPNSIDGPDTQMKVYVVPVDEDGTPIKATGSFKVEAFDLADPQDPLIGTWNFDLGQSRAMFYSRFGSYSYVLNGRWQKQPKHVDLTIRVAFTDELTGRIFVAQTPAKVRLASTRPN